MRFWPRSLLYRLLLIVLLGLLLANGLSLTLVMIERMSSARNVMLGNLEQDVATSVAILDRLPAGEREAWLPQLARGNYRYLLGPGEPGHPPRDARSRDAIRTITDTLAGNYPLRFTAVPGPVSHIQAHVTLHDGAPLTIDLIPRMPPVARWLPVVFILQVLLVALCSWLAVRQVVRPFTRFTRAVDALEPASTQALTLAEQGPLEVRQAARAFNAMQRRIQDYLQERAQILAAISHDLQTPITRMKLRVEMADQPELRDKLTADLDNMTRLVREGIAFARSSGSSEETPRRVDLHAFIDTLVCDYLDIGKNVQFRANGGGQPMTTRPQALRRVVTNLLDNALKFGDAAEVTLNFTPDEITLIVATLNTFISR
jgi:methyl-accepting chemotaxis protein